MLVAEGKPAFKRFHSNQADVQAVGVELSSIGSLINTPHSVQKMLAMFWFHMSRDGWTITGFPAPGSRRDPIYTAQHGDGGVGTKSHLAGI